jgi:ADP-heptose:LPS heptosyltransferase
MHILLIRLSSMGDVVIQTSLMAALKRQYGNNIKLSFVVGAEFADLLQGHPLLEDVITFDRKKQKLTDVFTSIIRLNQKIKIDTIIDLHGSLRSSLMRYRFFYIPSLVVDKRKVERAFLIYLKINFFKKNGLIQSQIERVLTDFSGIFNFSSDLLQISHYLKEQTADANRQLGTVTSIATAFDANIRDPKSENIIVFAPSASFENKRWPVERFIELAELIINNRKEKIIVLAGPQDDFCKAFTTLEKNHPDRLNNLQGKTTLLETNRIIASSQLVVGNDTGLIHIAESYAKKVLVIFGPTSEYFGFIPHGPISKSLSVDLWCRPCSATGAGKCFRAERFCMFNLTTQTVYQNVCSVLTSEVNCV